MSQLAFLFSGRGKDQVVYIASRQAWRYRPDFARWLAVNYAIWERFEREANKVYDRGRRHWSARTILEYMRHETALRENEGELKLNNNRAPDLARLYLTLYPERSDMFELRESDARKAA